MKTHQVSEEFILKAHKAACSGWKSRIEKEVPKLFEKKLEAGWYLSDGLFIFYDGKNSGNYSCYGFNKIGEWGGKNELGFHPEDLASVKATEEEVTEALYKEAERRYGKDWRNVKIKAHVDGRECYNDREYKVVFDLSFNRLWNRNGIIFRDGVWAEPLEELTDEAKKELVTRFDELKAMMEKHKLL